MKLYKWFALINSTCKSVHVRYISSNLYDFPMKRNNCKLNVCKLAFNSSLCIRHFSNKPDIFNTDSTTTTSITEKPTRTKKPPIPKITVISPDGNITVVTLSEAENIAIRRRLKLVKIIDLDTKSQRPVYKLMTGAQYLEEELKEKKAVKIKSKHVIQGEKLIMMSDRIGEHDLSMKMNKVIKWLKKKFEVRFIISFTASDMALAEKLCKQIESDIKGLGQIVQKRNKEHDIRFQILPPKEMKESKGSNELEKKEEQEEVRTQETKDRKEE